MPCRVTTDQLLSWIMRERIRTSDPSVPNHRFGKELSFCYLESCSNHEWRVTKAPVVKRGLRSESHQLHGDEDQQGSRCADGADCARGSTGTERAKR